MTPVGITLATLETALHVAWVQAAAMHNLHPESDVLDRIRLELRKLCELTHEEVAIWRRHGNL